MEFPKYAVKVEFNPNISSDIYMIGEYILHFEAGIKIFNKKDDIIKYLKNCTKWHESDRQYKKQWALFKALLYGWNSLSFRTVDSIYYQAMYHHFSMQNSKTNKSKISPIACFHE